MKTTFLVIFSILFIPISEAQINAGHLTYNSVSHIEFPDPATEEPGENEEEIALKKQMQAMFMQKLGEQQGDIKEYYFKENLARLVRPGNDKPNVQRFYEIDKLRFINFRKKEDVITSDTVIMDYRVNPAWQVEYSIETYNDDRKMILGFDCYKVILSEYRKIEDREYRTRYEMYVTPEIAFPPQAIGGLYDAVLKECALEIKVISLENENSWTLISAINFNKEFDESLLVFPK